MDCPLIKYKKKKKKFFKNEIKLFYMYTIIKKLQINFIHSMAVITFYCIKY